jgi:vacuolar-type H+-ATPase subunit H
MKNEKIEEGAVQALMKIREAEKRAREIVLEARNKAATEIIQKAYAEAKKDKDKFLKESKKKSLNKKNLIVGKAAEEAEEIRKKVEIEVKKHLERAEKALPEAVEKTSKKLKIIIQERRV